MMVVVGRAMGMIRVRVMMGRIMAIVRVRLEAWSGRVIGSGEFPIERWQALRKPVRHGQWSETGSGMVRSATGSANDQGHDGRIGKVRFES